MELLVLYRPGSYYVLCHCYGHLYCYQEVNHIAIGQTPGSNGIGRVAGNRLGINPAKRTTYMGTINKEILRETIT